MKNKPKIWKCNECSSNDEYCIFSDINDAGGINPNDFLKTCGGTFTKWVETDDYDVIIKNISPEVTQT